jgi:hypothetical protein
MKRILISLFAMTMLVFSSASAQDIRKSDKIVDTKFIVITSSLVASTIFDAETTFAAIKNPGVREANPVMKPLINAGRPATYAFLGGVDTGIVYASYRMKKSTNPTIRKLWWVMPVAAMASHAFAGSFNLRFTFH